MHYDYDNNYGPWAFKGWHGGGFRARRGDLSPIILRVLKDKPMHGYEIISRLEAMSHGMWRPSAGSVYPNLQMLEEQELVTSRQEDGKKVYELTDKGRKEAEQAEDTFKPHWEKMRHFGRFKEIKPIIGETIGYLRDIAAQDSDEKFAEVQKLLSDTRDQLAELARKEA